MTKGQAGYCLRRLVSSTTRVTFSRVVEMGGEGYAPPPGLKEKKKKCANFCTLAYSYRSDLPTLLLLHNVAHTFPM